MKYTIAGCITNYGVDDIKPYVESIEQSGFKGEKLMLVYDVSKEVIEYLDKKEIDISTFLIKYNEKRYCECLYL